MESKPGGGPGSPPIADSETPQETGDRALRERVEELEHQIEELTSSDGQGAPSIAHKIRRQEAITRRDALLAAGAAVSGAMLPQAIRSTAGTAAAQGSGREVGQPGKRIDVYGEYIDTSTMVVNDPPTVYVRSGGSDSNDGLSESNAKATISSAIDDGPQPPYSGPLIVDVGTGTFNEGRVRNDESRPYRMIVVRGDGDGSGNNNTTIDADAAGEPFAFQAGYNGAFRLINLDVVAGSGSGIEANQNGAIRCTATNLDTKGANFGYYAVGGGYINVDGNSSASNSGSAGSAALVEAIREGTVVTAADVTAKSGERCVIAAEGGGVLVAGGTLDAGGGSTVAYARQGAALEISNLTHLTNASLGVEVSRGSIGNFKSGVTWSTTDEYEFNDVSVVVDQAETYGARVLSWVLEAQDLTAAGAPTPTIEGILAFDTDSSALYHSDPGSNQWAEVGGTGTIAY